MDKVNRKLRVPIAIELPGLPVKITSSARRKSFHVKIITPIYGGGTQSGVPDFSMPIRGSALRGQLRFWWRLLHQATLLPKELFDKERELWGGMSEQERDYSSKLKLRICEIKNIRSKPCAEYIWDQARNRYKGLPKYIPEIPAYALFSAKGEREENYHRKVTQEPADVLLAGLEFTLILECPDGYWNDVEQTLRWWASFGGIGGRTRRGLGSVWVEGLKPITQEEVTRADCRLIIRNLKQPKQDAIKAWHEVIRLLQHFRQGDIGRNPGYAINRPGRSRWPEADSIREVTGMIRVKSDGMALKPINSARPAFPRAAFGLPIIFHFQNDRNDFPKYPGDCELIPKECKRMASPLILKAMALGDNNYVPIALLLPHNHVWNMDLELNYESAENGESENRKSQKIYPAGEWWPLDTSTRKQKISQISPLNLRGDDPLTAFLDFFEKGH